MCVKHGVDIIYHASWIDDEGMDMLEKAKDKHIVAPGLNWLIATVYEASAFGYSFEKAEQVGYKKELDVVSSYIFWQSGRSQHADILPYHS